jgi:uncharacterized protein YjcR
MGAAPMSDRPPELERAAQTFQDLKNLTAERDGIAQQFSQYRVESEAHRQNLEHQISIMEQHAHVLDKENDNLRGQLKRERAKGDHYMRAHSALKAYLLTLGPSIKQAVEMAESHSYGEKAPVPDIQTDTPSSTALSVVRRGPETDHRARTMGVLEKALMKQ